MFLRKFRTSINSAGFAERTETVPLLTRRTNKLCGGFFPLAVLCVYIDGGGSLVANTH